MPPDAPPRIVQLVAAPPGWAAVHADLTLDEFTADAPMNYLTTLHPVVSWALVDRPEFAHASEVRAVVAVEFSDVGVPNGIDLEGEDPRTFIGYLAPGRDIEDFRGVVVDHYERAQEIA